MASYGIPAVGRKSCFVEDEAGKAHLLSIEPVEARKPTLAVSLASDVVFLITEENLVQMAVCVAARLFRDGFEAAQNLAVAA